MIECPDLVTLEEGTLSPAVAGHVDGCASCSFVLEVLALKQGGDDCSRYEALLAAHADGTLGRAAGKLLDRHLSGCDDCRKIAETLAPTGDAAGDLATLPEVDPASYELGLEVARGGMGRILAARDLRVGRPVAVKELLGRTPALAARFEREARVTARLQHPGIVPIYEIGRWPDGTPFYSMRMVDGRTLRAAIDDAPTLAQRLALLPAVIDATDAVAFAHAHRIIHRDLTPSNVLLGAYGETVVIDWGLAKDLRSRLEQGGDDSDDDDEGDGVRARSGSDRLTALGAVVGTAAYMPPEQAHAVAVDERADVYALGAILYHVLAGAAPYQATASDRLLAAVRTGPPPPIDERAPGAPRDLLSIVTKAMARDPAARYPTARELSDELRRFTSGRLVSAHAYTRFERVRRFVARNRAAVALLAGALGTIAVVAWISIVRVLDSQAHSDRTARTLLEERGRSELLAGRPLKALAYLGAAHDPERPSPGRDFLLASALRELDDLEATVDCGADVQASAVSPDGLYLAAACVDEGRVWRLADHQLVLTTAAARDAFYWLTFGADGTLAFIGKDGRARVYDVERRALRHTLEHAAGVVLNRIDLSADGTRAVTSANDGKAIVWDLRTGERVRTISAGWLGFLGVYGQLTPDGQTLLTVTMGGVGSGWDVTTGALLGSLDHGGQILGGSLSRDGALAATCGADRRVRIWDLAARTARLTLTGHGDVVWKCVFSRDGTRLLTTSSDGTAKVWDLASGTLVTSVAPGDIVWWGELSPDGARIATANLAGSAQVWDAETGALLTSHDVAGYGAHFTADGARLVMERGDGKLQIWRRPEGRQRAVLPVPPGATLRDVSRDGARAVVQRGERLELWDVAARRPLVHEALAPPFALAAGAPRLVARVDGGAVVLDTATGATVARVSLSGLRTLSLDGAGRRLLVDDTSGPPRVLDVASGAAVATLAGATDAVLADDGRRALAWSDGGAPAVWTLDGGPPLALAAPGPGLTPVGFSADGERVALVAGEGASRALTVWSTADATRIAAVPAASAAVFDPRGALLTAIGGDGVVRVIRAADGAGVASFTSDGLTSAQVDAGGGLVVATDRRDGAVSILDAREGHVLARWPLRHATTINTTEEEGFSVDRTAAWWTPDGAAIVTRSLDATVWDATSLPPDAGPRIADVRRTGPWRVVDGKLFPRNASVTGRVARDGLPVAGARVTLTFREGPRSSTQTQWRAASVQPVVVTVISAADGGFRVPRVPAGDYTVSAQSLELGCTSATATRVMGELDQTVDLELTGCPAPP